MTAEQMAATSEASELLRTHVDRYRDARGCLVYQDYSSILPAAQEIRCSAWMKLENEVRRALTGEQRG